MRHILLTILLIITAIHAADFGDVSIIRLPALNPGQYCMGLYDTNTYRLVNNGAKPVAITISETSRFSSNELSCFRTRSLELAPMTMAHLTLYSPPILINQRYGLNEPCRIALNGKDLKLPPELAVANSPTGWTDGNFHYSLLSPSISDDLQIILNGYINQRTETTLIAPFSCEQWPVHVREYAHYQSILISSTDRIKPELRHALDDYVRLGGTLAIIVPDDAPWPAEAAPENPVCHTRRLGLGKIVTARPVTKQNKTFLNSVVEKMDDVSSNGRFKTLNEEGVFTKFPTLKRILDELTTTPNNNGCVIPDMLMKLPEYKLPLFPLLIVMAVFAIIIGPLNYWYLQRKHKQLLLVLTTPAISIVFCIIVFLFITFREGWRSHGTMVGFTLLDQTEHQATTIARAVMNAALRPSGGFRFSADEVLSFNQDSGTLEMRDEPGQVIGPSIMRTRVPLDINIRKTEPRREQIEISFSDDKATVVNGLGATIEDLIVIAPDNTVFRTDVPLQPGSTTILSAKTNPNTKTPPSFFTVEQIINQLGRNPNIDWIPPGHYFAKLKEPLFYSYGMKPDTMDATHYVIGRF